MATRREVVRNAQVAMRVENPQLVADGVWGAKTDRTYVASSPSLQDRIRDMVDSAGYSLANIRAAASAAIYGGQRQALLTREAERQGVSGRSLANLLATVQAESRFVPSEESHLYRNIGNARMLFGALRPLSDEQIRSLVNSGPKAFFETVYGATTSKGKELGNLRPGDGYRYRGRGYIQLTGRSNYEQLQAATGLPVVESPDILVSDAMASAKAAIWYWKSKVGSAGSDMAAATRIVNPGLRAIGPRMELAARFAATVA